MQMRKKLRQIILLAFLLSSVLFLQTRAEAAGAGWFEEGGKWYYTTVHLTGSVPLAELSKYEKFIPFSRNAKSFRCFGKI